MMIRKGRESKRSVVVVLDGITASTEKRGLAPLKKAMRDVNNSGDEILVLTLLYMQEEATDGAAGDSGDHDRRSNQSCEDDPHMEFLGAEVKIAAGFRPKDIIIEEANNAKASWIVMDRCFVRDLSFRLSGSECDVSLVSDEDDDEDKSVFHDLFLTGDHDGSESSMVMEVRQNYTKSAQPRKESQLQQKPFVCPLSPVLRLSAPSISETVNGESEKQSMSELHQENESPINLEPPEGETCLHDDTPRKCSMAKFVLGVPMQLSWEVVKEMTGTFSAKACPGLNKNYRAYLGYLKEYQLFVLVKRFTQDGWTIFEAEKKAASSVHHKNILGLLGYHQSENATVLVYPHLKEGTLDNVLCAQPTSENELKLKFQEKLKIATGIAQGVRYMHEECPGGPLVHGELQLSNIFLRHDLRPLISGFGHAKWLHLQRVPSVSNKRCQFEDTLNHEVMELVKSDVFSFGVLLIRLFCRRSMPQDDRSLIEWARPLMLHRKFHELLEEDEISDMHGIYRVMAAATQCTMTKAMLRPCMSEVISILKGKNFSAIEPSPSDTSL